MGRIDSTYTVRAPLRFDLSRETTCKGREHAWREPRPSIVRKCEIHPAAASPRATYILGSS